jgi:hypothetical protein
MLSHSLAVAAANDIIPFCDEVVHFSALARKAKRLTDDHEAMQFLRDNDFIRGTTTATLATEVMRESVPALGAVDVDEILNFRDKNKGELERFRDRLHALVSEVNSNPWDDNFAKHISDVVETTVRPELVRLRNQIERFNEKSWLQAVATAGKLSPIPFVGAIWGGVPPAVVLALGGGLTAAASALSEWQKKKKLARNGFSILFDTNRLASLVE